MTLTARFRTLGIQKRIMLYVTVGLIFMFGGVAFIGLRAIGAATDLILEERLNSAYTAAGILSRDFLHVARDVQEQGSGVTSDDPRRRAAVAGDLLEHFRRTDSFPFFAVSGVWVLDGQGNLVAQAGEPAAFSPEVIGSIAAAARDIEGESYQVLAAETGPSGSIPFGTVLVPVAPAARPSSPIVAVHTISRNRPTSYDPTLYGGAGLLDTSILPGAATTRGNYHLEVLRPDGIVVLGIGEDERPGDVSLHFSKLQALPREHPAATLLHKPGPGETFPPHVMAVVPVPSSPFMLVLEQPNDVALALPLELRRRLILFTSLGFVATLLVAWITTRHVVRPTEQLTVAALRMAGGDLERPVKVTAQDEVGKLAQSLELMRQKLKSAYERLQAGNEELERQVSERTARLTEVLSKLISAQEEERYRLARELHDETAQTLGALSISLDRARDTLLHAPSEATKQVEEAKAIATRLLEDTRRLIFDLRPLLLDDMGLVPAIRWYVERRLEEQGVEATVEAKGQPVKLPPHMEIAIFRVVQEAVNNIAKHASARHARVTVERRDSLLSIAVTDDGRGFDPARILAAQTPTGAVGLLGMQERVRLLNGHIAFQSRPGQGTQVIVEIPLEEKEA